jgi:polysaccharide deactylase WbmS-like protein
MNDKTNIIPQTRWITISECGNYEEVEDAIGLTFDLDWACDAVLEDCINLVDEADVPATWFVTHQTPILERLRANKKYELGIHPNFNHLLEGKGSDVESIIDELLTIAPNAKSIRSHSMVQSSRLMDIFLRKGLSYDCNHFVPEQSAIELRPWKLWNGLTKVPHFWEDDATCIYQKNTPIKELACRKGLKIFDFHPIHVFLNTENIERYETTKYIHSDGNALLEHRYTGIGTRTHLLELMRFFK